MFQTKNSTKNEYFFDIFQFALKQRNSSVIIAQCLQNSMYITVLKAQYIQHSANKQSANSTVLAAQCFSTLLLEQRFQHSTFCILLLAQCNNTASLASLQLKINTAKEKNSTDISAVSARFSISAAFIRCQNLIYFFIVSETLGSIIIPYSEKNKGFWSQKLNCLI